MHSIQLKQFCNLRTPELQTSYSFQLEQMFNDFFSSVKTIILLTNFLLKAIETDD